LASPLKLPKSYSLTKLADVMRARVEHARNSAFPFSLNRHPLSETHSIDIHSCFSFFVAGHPKFRNTTGIPAAFAVNVKPMKNDWSRL